MLRRLTLTLSGVSDEPEKIINEHPLMASNIKHGEAVLPELGIVEAITSAANGTYTAAISQDACLHKVVSVTSGGATEYVVLPKCSAELIGRVIYLTVGANGYELVTPSASGDTINQVDADGTNQLDVAANTTVRCTQISATGWLAETIAAATIAVTAPDND